VTEVGVDLEAFEKIALEELSHETSCNDIILVDEVGKMECFSKPFTNLFGEVKMSRFWS
jgi:nucleoside-triphosphatase THEP1